MRKRVLLRGALSLAALLVATPSEAQNVYFNPANAVGNGHAAAISFAAWSWSERTGVRAKYVGLTDQQCIDGAITVRTSTPQTWPHDLFPPTVKAYAAFCSETGYVVELRYDIGADQRVLTHELGHTLINLPKLPFYGAHLADSYSIMNANPKEVTAVTHLEAKAALRYSRWPLRKPASFCHVELLPNNDLYIPDIGGNRIQLSYQGVIDGYHTWHKRSATAATVFCANNVLNASGNAILRDIRGQFIRHAYAEFEFMGNDTWRLISLGS